MFNVAVINIKDIGKVAIKLIILICVITIIATVINNNKNIEKSEINYSFLQCLDICIPGLKQINFEKHENVTVSKLLSVELPMSSYVIEKEDVTTNDTEKKIEQNTPKESKPSDYVISIQDNVTTEVMDTNVPESYTDEFNNVYIKNGTDFDLTEEMVSQNIEFKNPQKLLIYHTHTSESYTPSEEFPYEMTGNFRTTDLNYTVARVGTELTNYLDKLRL